MRAIYVNIFVMCAAMLSLASCSSDDNVERRLTTNQKERYAQNISGEYSGEYIIVYKDKDCTDMTDEKGRHIITKAHEATFSDVQLDVSDYKMQHIFFQDFPVSLISKVVDADEELSQALAEASPQAITARYGFDYDTDYSHIKWAFIPNVMLLNSFAWSLTTTASITHLRRTNCNSQKRSVHLPKTASPCNWKLSTTAPLSYSASAMRKGTICILSLRQNNIKIQI